MKSTLAVLLIVSVALVAFTDARVPRAFDSATTGVICPDKDFTCSDGQTCCKLNAGGYGCCGMAEAVCCSDGQHCCPHGTTCDLKIGTCVRSQGFFLPPVHEPLSKKQKALRLKKNLATSDETVEDDETFGRMLY